MKTILAGILTCFLTLFSFNSANALEWDIVEIGNNNSEVVLIAYGDIRLSDIQFLEQYHQALNPVALYISSGGGDLLAGYAMGRYIADNEIPVRIDQRAVCASACTFLLLSSPNPSIHPASRIGLHAPYWQNPDNDGMPTYYTPTVLNMYRWYVEHGVPDWIALIAMSQRMTNMFFLSIEHKRMIESFVIEEEFAILQSIEGDMTNDE